MLQLRNDTPYPATLAVFPDERGVETLYVVMKATFVLADGIELAPKQLPLRAADVHWGDPASSSLRYASEMHLTKPGTDVVLNGQAWAPRRRSVRELDVELCVEDRSVKLRVFGDRTWKGGILGMSASDPEPFRTMPLRYERAFGGVDEPVVEERNPVGIGIGAARKRREWAGRPLPNLESPEDLLMRPGQIVRPVGFGFVAPAWMPRRAWAGTYDERWQKERCPFLPEDFDPRFFCAACPELIAIPHLRGGERFRLVNLREAGGLTFRLPNPMPVAEVVHGGRTEPCELNLETVLLEPDEEFLSLTWRGAVSCPEGALRVDSLTLQLGRDVDGGDD